MLESEEWGTNMEEACRAIRRMENVNVYLNGKQEKSVKRFVGVVAIDGETSLARYDYERDGRIVRIGSNYGSGLLSFSSAIRS